MTILTEELPDLSEGFKIVGKMTAVLYDEDGNEKDRREVDNLIVTTGVTAIVQRLDSSPATGAPSHMGLGTSGTAPAAGNTTLTAEPTRVVLSTNSSSGAVHTMVASFGAGVATGSWQEAGVFTAISSGVMYSRATVTP